MPFPDIDPLLSLGDKLEFRLDDREELGLDSCDPFFPGEPESPIMDALEFAEDFGLAGTGLNVAGCTALTADSAIDIVIVAGICVTLGGFNVIRLLLCIEADSENDSSNFSNFILFNANLDFTSLGAIFVLEPDEER